MLQTHFKVCKRWAAMRPDMRKKNNNFFMTQTASELYHKFQSFFKLPEILFRKGYPYKTHFVCILIDYYILHAYIFVYVYRYYTCHRIFNKRKMFLIIRDFNNFWHNLQKSLYQHTLSTTHLKKLIQAHSIQ